LVDPDFGELLAVSVFLSVAFAALLLENNHLVSFDKRIQDGSADGGAFHDRHAYLNLAVLCDQQNLVEPQVGTFGGF
jgi:hypothetical protein